MIEEGGSIRIDKALEYWGLIDVLTQSPLPDRPNEPIRFTEDRESTNVSITSCFRNRLTGDAKKTVLELVESDIADICDKHNEEPPTKRQKANLGTKDLQRLGTIVATRDYPPIVEISVFLGIVPKEPVIAALEEKTAATASKSKKRQEIETDEMACALAHLNRSGVVTGIEISPIIWLISRDRLDATSDLLKNIKDREEGLRKELSDRCAGRPATIDDLRYIADSLFPPFLSGRIAEFFKRHPSYGNGRSGSPAHRSLVSYRASNDSRLKPFSASLHSSFYSKDIKALRHALQDADGDLEALNQGQLKLAISYLEGGLEHHDVRDRRRLDIQSATDEDARRRTSLFYHHALSLDNTPLGRWPSKCGLSLMQQVAVNMVAGRNTELLAKEAGAPVSDVMSVNGPPGTGKTTLLKDIIAANIVEKARLLASYEDPDQAFSKIEDVGEYLKYAKNAYRLIDPKIAELGIIVCSSNNNAVENISKELPKGEALLSGLEDRTEDQACERDMFTGRAKDGRELFEAVWGQSASQKGALEDGPDLYFSSIARRQFETKEDSGTASATPAPNEGPFDMLISARLGKRSNIEQFQRSILRELVYGTNTKSRKRHRRRFNDARQMLIKQYEHVKSLMAKHASAQHEVLKRQKSLDDARGRLGTATIKLKHAVRVKEETQRGLREALLRSLERLKQYDEYENHLEQVHDIRGLRDLEDQLCGELSTYTGELEKLDKRLRAAQNDRDNASAVFGLLAKRRLENNVIEAEGELCAFRERNRANERLNRFKQAITEELAALEPLGQEFHKAKDAAELAAENLERANAGLRDAQLQFDRAQADCRWELAPEGTRSITDEHPNSRTLHDAHLFTPAANVPDEGTLRYERDKLFLRALQVTRDFILASDCVASNFRLLNVYWGARDVRVGDTRKSEVTFSDEDARKMVPALFQTLGILTPVISTTFASAGRMLRDIPIANAPHAPLGLCVIDEAGQATPQAAVGILARCTKALVVGDPYQIEPVVDPAVNLLAKLFGEGIDAPFKRCTSSVQALADAANPIGHYRDNGAEEPEWIGCPLVVHRRCASPMFEISNEISYNNAMINETTRLDPKKDAQVIAGFYLPSSQWINVAGRENGNGDHFVSKQGDCVAMIVREVFEKKPQGERIPSLYIVSSFSTVVNGMRKALKKQRPDNVTPTDWERFIRDNIGTVHKFQGKEAQEVVFVLGCDSSSTGAVKWVNPNIVNVAASRARQRLYVIGDYNIWGQNEPVSTMKRIIDTAWIDLLHKSKEDGDKGLDEVRRALPRHESLPVIDCDGEPLDTDDFRDTDDFLENVRPLLAKLTLSTSVCERFGFKDEQDLDSTFAPCADSDRPSSNRVLSNIKMGMFLYDLFDIDHRTSGGDQEDWSFCAIMFCRAAELFLQHELLPSLKGIDPDLPIVGNRTISNCKELSLGQYHHALCKAGAQAPCGMAAGYQCGNSLNATATVIESATPRDPVWWRRFGKNLEKLARIRNGFCHAGRSLAPDIKNLLDKLFPGNFKQKEQGEQDEHITLLHEGRTLRIAKEGIGSKSFARTMQELVDADSKPHAEQPSGSISTGSQNTNLRPGARVMQQAKPLGQNTGSKQRATARPMQSSDAEQGAPRQWRAYGKWLEDEQVNVIIPPSLKKVKTKEINKLLACEHEKSRANEKYMSREKDPQGKTYNVFTPKALEKWNGTIKNNYSAQYGNSSPLYTLEGFKAVLNFYAERTGIHDRI